MTIKLFTPFFVDSSPERHQENLTCLQNNLANPLIDEIVLFVDDPKQYEQFLSSKLRLVATREPRPTYQDFLDQACREPEPFVLIMANTDIYFDQSLEHLNDLDWTNLLVCLTRRDVEADGNSYLCEHYQSSDAWIVKAPFKNFICPIRLGRLHCESTFLAYAHKAGFKLINAGLTVAAHHLHRTGKRNYDPTVDKYSDGNSMAFPMLGSLAQVKPSLRAKKNPHLIAVDGEVFSFNSPGAAKVLGHLLNYWSETDFAEKLVILDRANSSPKLPNLRYHQCPYPNIHFTVGSARVLRQICLDLGVSKFLSANSTQPFGIPSVQLVFDMMQEVFYGDLEAYRSKIYSMLEATALVAFNAQIRLELENFFSAMVAEKTVVLPPPVSPYFIPASSAEVLNFKAHYRLTQPYFLMVGHRSGHCGYVNGELVFSALQQMQAFQEVHLLCVGGAPSVELHLQGLLDARLSRVAYLQDQELNAAYAGALGLIYAKRTDFSCLQIIEAMKCGCPIIAPRLPSVLAATKGNAFFYEHSDPASLLAALRMATDPALRAKMTEAAFHTAKGYSIQITGDAIRALLEHLPV